ncbi:MAG: DUF1295 domain-containing protein [Sphingobacteriales bacterium]|nr:MAG: DUF1295 domain-containing protein [Sphingobacteriales bacterium]
MNSFVVALSVDLLVMILCYVYCQSRQRAGLVDAAWAFCIAVTAIGAAVLHTQGDVLVRWVIGAMTGLWFARLSWHLARRYWQEDQEDSRYAAMRKALKDHQSIGFFGFFMAQALMALLFSVPMLLLTAQPTAVWSSGYQVWLTIAVIIAVVAFIGETVADQQLYRFKQVTANRGKTLRSGLWRYSRHPNYFFEFVHWFAYLALAVGAGPWPLALAALGPVVMFVFLYRFTGIPYTEQQALRSRGEDYAQYQRSTSAFFPLPPSS